MKNFLLQNLLPYMGNKADNLSFIDSVLNSIVKKDKELQNKIIKFADLFSGSGVVSRLAKSKGYSVFTNDLELYAKIVTEVPIRYYEEQVERIFGFVADKLKIKKGESNYLSVIEYLNDLKKIVIPVPPITLQNQFSEIVKQIDKQKFEIEKSLKETQELYESLMEKYFG